MKKYLYFIYIVFFFLVFSGSAMAISFTFTDIPSDDNPDLDLSANFTGELTDLTGQVMFTLYNNGPEVSTIASIYFEYDPPELMSNGSFSAADSSEGVSFDMLGNTNLPQGNNISFDAEEAQTAEKPAPHNGVNVGEHASFIFTGDYEAIAAAMVDGNLRIGIHVINIDELSDGYISQIPVPEPATALLMGLGLLGLGYTARRKKI